MINMLKNTKNYFLILFLIVFIGCSRPPKSYNVYKITYEVLYPNATVTKNCIIKGEVSTGCTTTGFFKNGPLLYFIDGEHELNKIYDSYPIIIKNKSKIKTIQYY